MFFFLNHTPCTKKQNIFYWVKFFTIFNLCYRICYSHCIQITRLADRYCEHQYQLLVIPIGHLHLASWFDRSTSSFLLINVINWEQIIRTDININVRILYVQHQHESFHWQCLMYSVLDIYNLLPNFCQYFW